MIIKAKYESICPQCDHPINVGDKIVWERGLQSYHDECPDEEWRLPKPEPGLVRFYRRIGEEAAWDKVGTVIHVGLGHRIVVVRVWGYCFDENNKLYFSTEGGEPVCADCRPATDDEVCEICQNEILESHFDRM